MRFKLGLSCLLLSSAVANAGLLGTNVTVGFEFSGSSTTDVVTVGSGVEITCPGPASICSFLTAPTQTIDITDNRIVYTYTGPGAAFDPVLPNEFVFSG